MDTPYHLLWFSNAAPVCSYQSWVQKSAFQALCSLRNRFVQSFFREPETMRAGRLASWEDQKASSNLCIPCSTLDAQSVSVLMCTPGQNFHRVSGGMGRVHSPNKFRIVLT